MSFCNTLISGVPANFNPGTLAWDGWWRAEYTGAPWLGTTSTGISGGGAMTEGTNPPPVSAQTQNGYHGPFWNDNIVRLTPNGTLDTYANAQRFGGYCFIYLTSISTSSTTAASNANAVATEGSSRASISFYNVGGITPSVMFDVFDSGSVHRQAVTPITLNTLQMIRFRQGATLAEVGVNANAMVTAACVGWAAASLTFPLVVGLNPSLPAGIRGTIVEIGMTSAFSVTDGNFTSILGYGKRRYGAALA